MRIVGWWASGDAREHMLTKHGVHWDEVDEILWQYPPLRRIHDVRGEKRYVVQGQSANGRYLTIVFELQGPIARVITAYDTPRRMR